MLEGVKCLLFRKKEIKNACDGKYHSLSVICNQLATDIIAIYQRASIPTVSIQRIVKQLQDCHGKYQNMMRSSKNPSESANFEQKFKVFFDESKQLFDFSSCKCVLFANCNCVKDKKHHN